MAYSDPHDSRPLITEQDDGMKEARDSAAALPEVVPVENLRGNGLRHGDSGYLQNQNPTQPFTPLSHSDQGSSRYTAHTIPALYPQSSGNYINPRTLPPRGFHKTSRKKISILVALVTFLFTALALGTGLGIPLSQALNKLNPNNYQPLAPGTVISARKNGFCTDKGQTPAGASNVFTTRHGNASFDIKCGIVMDEGLAALNPLDIATSQGTVRNIAAIVSYRVDDCVSACASLNDMAENPSSSNPKCQSVTFIPAMQGELSKYAGNCFLKNSTVFDLGKASVMVNAVSAEVHRLRTAT